MVGQCCEASGETRNIKIVWANRDRLGGHRSIGASRGFTTIWDKKLLLLDNSIICGWQ